MTPLVRRSDIVFHLGAAVGVKYILDHQVDSILTNVMGTENILNLASRFKKTVLIASSSEVYGKHPAGPLHEDDDRLLGSTTVPRWSYADAKALDEFLALAYARERGLKAVIMRFFNVVGPRQVSNYGMVIPRFVEAALKNKPLTVYGDGSQIRSFMHVRDTVQAMIGLSQSPEARGRVFNIGDDAHPVSIHQLAKMIREKTGSRSKIILRPYRDFYGPNFEDVAVRIPDISRLKKTIRYRPAYTLDTLLDEIIASFKFTGA